MEDEIDYQVIATCHAQVELHFARGGQIEAQYAGHPDCTWRDCSHPTWNWERFNYRKKETRLEGFITIFGDPRDFFRGHPPKVGKFEKELPTNVRGGRVFKIIEVLPGD